MIDHAENALEALGCAKVNLQVRAGNEAAVAFYESMDYGIEPRVSMGKQMVDDRTSHRGPRSERSSR